MNDDKFTSIRLKSEIVKKIRIRAIENGMPTSEFLKLAVEAFDNHKALRSII